MNYIEQITVAQAMREVFGTKRDSKPPNRGRRIMQAGEVAAAALLLAGCGVPAAINKTPRPVVVLKPSSHPTELAVTPTASPTPEAPGRQTVFGLINLDDVQRLSIRQTEADVEIEVAPSPGKIPPQIRNPFEDAKVTQLYDKDSDLAKSYGVSICLETNGKKITFCINNFFILSQEVREAFISNKPLAKGITLGTMGLDGTLPNYPAILPDEQRYRIALSAIDANGKKIPLQDVIKDFREIDPRTIPQ